MAMPPQLCQRILNQWVRSPYAYRSYYNEAGRRSLRYYSTDKASLSDRRLSTVDVTYMPQYELNRPQQSEVLRVPILPNNSTAPTRANEVFESVIRPEITTVSASGTHIDSPSAMGEVTDNHAVDISPFDLTGQVTNAATAAASKMTDMSTGMMEKPGMFQDFWSGLLDDVLGGKKVMQA